MDREVKLEEILKQAKDLEANIENMDPATAATQLMKLLEAVDNSSFREFQESKKLGLKIFKLCEESELSQNIIFATMFSILGTMCRTAVRKKVCPDCIASIMRAISHLQNEMIDAVLHQYGKENTLTILEKSGMKCAMVEIDIEEESE